MKKPVFEILDSVDTPLGVLYLRRRELLSRPGTIVTEVTLDSELLMSSLNTDSEVALSERALAWRGGEDSGLRVLVGGLGLGYTAAAALGSDRVAVVRVVEHLPAVIGWISEGKVPLAEQLSSDSRVELAEGDVYAELLAAPAEGAAPWDLILIDVDHTPTEHLGPTSAPFYTAAAQATIKAHLAPEGVLAVWSAGDNDDYAATLGACFAQTHREHVSWINELINDGQEIEDVIFLARD
ncbi:MAG: spermidine synthase [Planctomycetes bacterium]|nr:spermidine synthase [Planctomycetota bacterium]